MIAKPDGKDFQFMREIDTMNTKWMIIPTRGMLGKIITVHDNLRKNTC